VADPEFAAELAQGDVLNTVGHESFLRRTKQFFAKISMMIGTGRRFQ
jgi:hypothetical protein